MVPTYREFATRIYRIRTTSAGGSHRIYRKGPQCEMVEVAKTMGTSAKLVEVVAPNGNTVWQRKL